MFQEKVKRPAFVNEFLSFARRFRAKAIIHIFVANYCSI